MWVTHDVRGEQVFVELGGRCNAHSLARGDERGDVLEQALEHLLFREHLFRRLDPLRCRASFRID